MKKFLVLFSLLISSLLFVSCGPSEKQALTYNDAIVDEQKLIMTGLNAFFEALSKPGDTVAINATLTAVQQQVAAGQTNLGKIEAFDGSTTLRDATLELFNVYQSVLSNELKTVATNYKLPAERYDDSIKATTDALYDQALQKMDQSLTKLEREQKAFAEKYHIEVK